MASNDHTEELLQAMRIGLAYAHQMERDGKHEAADAAGARAANKLALAIYVQRRDNVIPFTGKVKQGEDA